MDLARENPGEPVGVHPPPSLGGHRDLLDEAVSMGGGAGWALLEAPAPAHRDGLSPAVATQRDGELALELHVLGDCTGGVKATRVLVEQQRFAQTSGQSVCGDGAGHFTDGTSTDPADIFVDRWGIDSTSVLVPVAE